MEPKAVILNDEDLEIIRKNLAHKLTDDEFKFFIRFALGKHLNPLLKEIYAIKTDKGHLAFVSSVDGMTKMAHRSGKLEGIERGIRRDGQVTYAYARIYRNDWQYPIYEEINLNEYRRHSEIWAKMPEQMGKKCALSAALRLGFPEDLGGIYGEDEIVQAPTESQNQAKAKSDLYKHIFTIQKNFNLTREQIQEITGFESIKKLGLEQLEEAFILMDDYTKAQVVAQKVSAPNHPEDKAQEEDMKAVARGLAVKIISFVSSGRFTLDDLKKIGGFEELEPLVAALQIDQLQDILDKVTEFMRIRG